MSFINYNAKEIHCKVVYYGPSLGGKTTNIQWVYQKTAEDQRSKLVALNTDIERTLFFDFLPLNVGDIRGFKTRFHLYTVPGPSGLRCFPETDSQRVWTELSSSLIRKSSVWTRT